MPGLRHDRLSLPPDVADAALAHARAELPNEACGLIAGDRTTGRATAFHPARNEHRSPLRFSVHPEDLVRLVLEIDACGEHLLAIFHSHVASEAVPSAADLRGAAAYPDALHLIATLAEPSGRMRAWRIADAVSHEIALVVG